MTEVKYTFPAWFGKLYEGMLIADIQAKYDKWKKTLPSEFEQGITISTGASSGSSDVTFFEGIGTQDMQMCSETKPSNPKDRAATHRLDISLFPMTAIIGGALAMTEGDCKYGGYNYRAMGVNVSTYISALDRHKAKFYNGEWADEKTLVAHLDSMIACCAILRDGFAIGNIVDDRPPKVDVTAMLNDAEKQVAHLHEIFPNCPERFTEVLHGTK